MSENKMTEESASILLEAERIARKAAGLNDGKAVSETPRDRDLMAVFHFYSGDTEQKHGSEVDFEDFVKQLPQSMFIRFSSGTIRQTKDIEKIVTSYC